jgi:DNA (cytosine-5)-methyltransferase 1
VRVVDLFSGVGGLGLGFSLAGFTIEAAVDVDQRRASAYGGNIKPRRVIASDVRGVDFSQFRGVDVIIAGPPCRPYSIATPRAKRGTNHPEYGLDLEVLRAVREVMPKAVVVEEVPNWSPEPLARGLEGLGYSVAYRLIPFSEYGVPTMRRRWIVVALRGGSASAVFTRLEGLREAPPRPIDLLRGLPPDPCGEDPCMHDGAVILNHVNYGINSRIRELIPKIPPGYSLVTAHRAGFIDASRYVKDVERKHRYWLYRVPIDGLVKVVPHPRRSMMLHPIYDRMITVRELARLFTFPDWFDFRPLPIDGMYRAITDSVPPKFSRRLAGALAEVLGGGYG